MGKIIGFSIVVVLVFTAFFYFYPTQIFEAKITENGAVYALDISLKSYLDHGSLPEVVSQQNLISVVPTWKGALLLIICLIGIPIMIGYRIATNKVGANQTKK